MARYPNSDFNRQAKQHVLIPLLSLSLMLSACGSDDDAPLDTSPPSFTGITSVSAQGATNLLISWETAVDDITPAAAIRYRIYVYAPDPNLAVQDPGEAVATVTGLTEYRVRELSIATQYEIIVEAVDEAGNSVREEFPSIGTTSTVVSFQWDLYPMFIENCSSSGCHGATSFNKFAFTTLQDSFDNLVGASMLHASCTNRIRVVAGSAADSELVKKLDPGRPTNPAATSCGAYMPKDAEPIAQNMYDALVSWIDTGAEYN